MKKITRLLLLGALSMVSYNGFANELKLSANDSSGNTIEKVTVALNSRITFNDEGICVYEGENLVASIPYTNLYDLTFNYEGGSGKVENVNVSPLRLKENPVKETLEFTGYEGESTPLSIFALNGTCRLRAENWNGEPVNVASLSPGIYFAIINNNTFKFIKK